MNKDRIDFTKDYSNYTKEDLEKVMKKSWAIFCHALCKNGWNATRAYKTAYPNSSDKTAGHMGGMLQLDPRVKAYIKIIKDDFEQLCKVSKAKQLIEYMKIAYSSIANLHDTWIELKDFESISEEDKAAIESIETKTEEKLDGNKNIIEVKYVKIKLHSKISALDKIDKLLGYNSPEKLNLDTNVTLGTGNIEAIRKAFKLNELSNPIKSEE